MALGLGVLDREPVVAAARPELEAEARASGETLFLAAARGGRIAVLDKVEGTGFLCAAPTVRLPAAHTERVARRVVAAARRIGATLEGRVAA